MDRAIWKNKSVTAFDVSVDIALENEIREASVRRELKCPNPQCERPCLIYRHGPVRIAHFAHLSDSKCAYEEYSKDIAKFRKIRYRLYNHFVNLQYRVDLDVQMSENHFSQFIVTSPNNKPIAIEFIPKNVSVKKLRSLTEQYNNQDVSVFWFVVSNDNNIDNTYFRLLSEDISPDSIFIISPNASTIWMHKKDNNDYRYKGYSISVPGFLDSFSYKASIDDVIIKDNKVTLKWFLLNYKLWEIDKNDAFNEFVRELKRKEKQQKEAEAMREAEEVELEKKRQEYIDNLKQQKAIKKQREENLFALPKDESPPNKSPQKSYEERKAEVQPLIEQGKTAKDSTGVRWRKCVLCGKTDVDREFAVTGGEYGINGGKCKKCMP